jgi:hypothetical protein
VAILVGMVAPRPLVGLAVCAALLLSGCQDLLGADSTPVPGAAATLTRSSRTPIPTPNNTPSSVSPSPAASPARSPAPVVSPAAAARTAQQAQVDRVERALGEALATEDLAGIEGLLYDRVSLSTADGGQVLDRQAAADWLREHAGPGLRVGQVDRSTLSPMLEIRTEGWPDKPPVTSGHVTFNLHKYDAAGKQDDDTGDWRIDVIGTE